MNPQRPSGRRFAAFVVGLAFAAAAFGGLVLPHLAEADLPASMKPKPALIEQKLGDHRCPGQRLRDPGT